MTWDGEIDEGKPRALASDLLDEALEILYGVSPEAPVVVLDHARPSTTGRPRRWTRELVIEAIQAYAKREQRSPGVDAFRTPLANNLPARATIKQLGLTPSAAVRAAGYRPVRHKPRHRPDKQHLPWCEAPARLSE